MTSRMVLAQMARQNGYHPRWWWSAKRLLASATVPRLTPDQLRRRAAHFEMRATRLDTRASEFNQGLAMGYRIGAEELRFLAGDPLGVVLYVDRDDSQTPTDPGITAP